MLVMRVFSAFIASVIAFANILFGFSSGNVEGCNPVFNGTFLQSPTCTNWDDERWNAEVEAMQDAGIKYLILQSTADKDADSNWTVYYDSSLSEFNEAAHGAGDVIEAALSHCRSTDIKVFIGLDMFDNFWSVAAITQEYKSICGIAAEMAQEIYGEYYSTYADSFGGWYFTPEISNNIICQLSIAGFCNGLNILIDKIDSLNPDLPLLISPFNTEYLSTGYAGTLFEWIMLFKLTDFRDGDIFAPQDAVGARWTDMNNLRRNWQMYKAAVDCCQAEVKLWANCENFDIAITESFGSGTFSPPATENTEYVTATLDRFVEQMKIASEYCENIITFSYNHYFSPNVVSPSYMDTYKDYVRNGYVLESNAPEAVPDFYKGQYDGNALLTWSEPEDDFGIAYYRICKNGEFLTRIECCFDKPINQFYDWGETIENEYTITAYDFAGNASPVSTAK